MSENVSVQLQADIIKIWSAKRMWKCREIIGSILREKEISNWTKHRSGKKIWQKYSAAADSTWRYFLLLYAVHLGDIFIKFSHHSVFNVSSKLMKIMDTICMINRFFLYCENHLFLINSNSTFLSSLLFFVCLNTC